MRRVHLHTKVALAAGTMLATLAMHATVFAQQAPIAVPEVQVLGVTPILGGAVERNKIPTNVQVVNPNETAVPAANGVAETLATQVPNVTFNHAQNNPFQPDIQFRGYTASPLLGNSQGLAVYQNGVRINEVFGDTVNWDLIPDTAIDQLNVVPGGWNAVYGLNALGGALSLDMKDGFSFRGTQAGLEAGRWGRRKLSIEHGTDRRTSAFYFAADALEEDGWRDLSPSTLRRMYGDFSHRGDKLDLSINFTGAQNTLVGNGAAPVELLAVRRQGIFTAPDETTNTLAMLVLNGNYFLSDRLSLQFVANLRRLLRDTLNGDGSEFEECEGTNVGETDAATLAPDDPDDFLCEDAGDADEEIALDQNGDRIRASEAREGAVNNYSGTRTTSYGVGLQTTWEGMLGGRENRIIFGGGYDNGRTKFHSETELGALDERRFAIGDGVFVGETFVRAHTDTKYYGLFFVDTIELNNRLDLNIAARYNEAKVKLSDQIGDELNGDHSFRRLNPALGLTYAFRPGAALSLSYSEANRAPTAAELTCADPEDPCRFPNAFVADPPLEQVVSKTFEIGARGGVGNWDWNGALFRTTSYDDIIFISSGPGTQSGYFDNVGETRRQGVELGFRAKFGRLTTFANYSYMQATFQTPFTINSPNNPFADDDEINVEAGDKIPLLPTHNYKVGADFDVNRAWVVGGTLQGVSSQYFRGDEANLASPVPGFQTVNLHTRYRVRNSVDLFARVDNVFDTDYETFGIFGEVDEVEMPEAPGAEDPRMMGAGQPRTFSVGLKVRF